MGLQSIIVKKWAPLQWVISIATWCHVCLTLKAPFDQCTGAGSIDWHSSHSLTTALTAALETPGAICLTKSVRHTPGWPLCRWITLIWSSPTELTDAVQAGCTGPMFLLMASSHLWGTLVNRSALFWLDLTKDTFIDSMYSFTSFIMVSSRRRMSISLATLVHTLALPVRVSEIHLWTQAESVNKCKVVVFQRIAKFTPLIMASSSARLMCWESFAGRNQQASSTTASSYTSDTPVARELASTHTLRAWPSTHHLPRARSSLHTLMRTSLIMVLRGASSILSSHPAVTSLNVRTKYEKNINSGEMKILHEWKSSQHFLKTRLNTQLETFLLETFTQSLWCIFEKNVNQG